MSDFHKFKIPVTKQFRKLSSYELFVTDIEKDLLWKTYLNSFSSGTNEIFRERRAYDCQSCRQFIRACGNVVAIIDNQLVSIWDVKTEGYYQTVADSMANVVKSNPIKDIFLHLEKNLGTDFNHQKTDNDAIIKWEHFFYELPPRFINKFPGSVLSEVKSTKDVFKRGLEEITIEAIEIVLDLISQKSLYRGEEHEDSVTAFKRHKEEFYSISSDLRDNFCWKKAVELKQLARIRNTAIGTLLVDISSGTDLDIAVKSFESKVAPENYKRPTTVITKSMIAKAQQKVEELGIEPALKRRYAVIDDITINNVLFADREAKKAMNVFDELTAETPELVKNFEKVESVDIETFIHDIIPRIKSAELLFENRYRNNLVSLIAPVDPSSKNILKWNNNFSWSYNGEVTDSIKENVKKHGGKVDGVLRFSIQWNEKGDNENDFDAHCLEPDGNHIYYPKKAHKQKSTGMLDVDIIHPQRKVAVENITWTDRSKMPEGIYKFWVNNFTNRGGLSGFSAEIEFDGQLHSFDYNKTLRSDENIAVAKVEFNRNTGFKLIESMPSTHTSKEIWGLKTNVFQRISVIMNSPNHWDGNKTGNKHYFFMLDGCMNVDQSRGFYNEFLSKELIEHRKVFEVLGSKLKTEKSNNQLSGLGFSSTKRDYVLCKLSGNFNRIIKITF